MKTRPSRDERPGAKAGNPPARGRCLRERDLFGLQAFGTALDDERHARAFIQRPISIGLNRREMHEHIFPAIALDKSKAFSGVKPLYCTCFFHFFSLRLLVADLNAIARKSVMRSRTGYAEILR